MMQKIVTMCLMCKEEHVQPFTTEGAHGRELVDMRSLEGPPGWYVLNVRHMTVPEPVNAAEIEESVLASMRENLRTQGEEDIAELRATIKRAIDAGEFNGRGHLVRTAAAVCPKCIVHPEIGSHIAAEIKELSKYTNMGMKFEASHGLQHIRARRLGDPFTE